MLTAPYEVKPNNIYAWDANMLTATMKACGMRVHTVVTSPPYYGLRDYGADGQIGLEQTPDDYVRALVTVFRGVRDVLRDDGTLWINIGDTYASGEVGRHDSVQGREIDGKRVTAKAKQRQQQKVTTLLPPKSRLMIPARLALALQADGWILRDEIVWHKPAPMPEPVQDRTVKAHEMIYLFSKSPRYYFDSEAIAEPALNAGEIVVLGDKSFSKGQAAGAGIAPTGNGKADTYTVKATRNKRSVWTVNTEPSPIPHFAMYPQKLIEPCILAGAPAGGLVLDPFMGGGTTALVAQRLGRQYVGSELNPEYAEIARYRVSGRIDEYLAKTRGEAYTAYMFGEQTA